MIKPTLTKAEDQAFKDFVGNNYSKQNRVLTFNTNHDRWYSEFAPLRNIGFDKFVLALYNGYEVEKDLSDKVLDIIMQNIPDYDANYLEGVRNDIMEAIDQWNLKDGASTIEENPDLTKPR